VRGAVDAEESGSDVVQEADDVRTGQEKARSGKWATYGLTTEVTVMGKEL
jgi:hypothetical protein